MRLIDADALKANCEITIGDTTIGRRVYVMFHEIDSAPTIEAVPKDFHDKTCEAMAKRHTEEIQRLMPKRGEWIPCTKNGLPLTELGRRERQKWYGYKCSKCNFIYKGNALTESPFCQNCGVRMKGADDE